MMMETLPLKGAARCVLPMHSEPRQASRLYFGMNRLPRRRRAQLAFRWGPDGKAVPVISMISPPQPSCNLIWMPIHNHETSPFLYSRDSRDGIAGYHRAGCHGCLYSGDGTAVLRSTRPQA